MKYIKINCNLCGSDTAKLYSVYNGEGNYLHKYRVKCKKCGLVYSNPQATKETLQQYYSTIYPGSVPSYTNSTKEIINNYEKYFSELNTRIKPGNFLDVGCAGGNLLSVGERLGWKTYGVEISKLFYECAKSNLKSSFIFNGELHEAKFEDNFFDYVYMSQVLEHVTDPTLLLNEINRILKTEGELFIDVPNIAEPFNYNNWVISYLKKRPLPMITGNEHTYDFSPRTLTMLLQKCRFRIRTIKINYLKGTFATDKRKLNCFGRLELSCIKNINRLFPNKCGNRIRVTATKY